MANNIQVPTRTPAVVERQSASIDLAGGINEKERAEVLDWTKNLVTQENLVINSIRALSKRQGLTKLATTDDAGNPYSPIYRDMPMFEGVGIIGSGYSLYHLNEGAGKLVNKGKLPELGLINRYTVSSNGVGDGVFSPVASGDAEGQILDTAFGTKVSAIAYNNATSSGSSVPGPKVVITDRYSGQEIRTYSLGDLMPNAYSAMLKLVDDRYLHVYVNDATNQKFFQLDTTSLPADLSAISPVTLTASGAANVFVCAMAVSGNSVVVITDWTGGTTHLEKFNTSGASAATLAIGATFKCSGGDTDGTDILLIGKNATPKYVIKAIAVSGFTVGHTYTDAGAVAIGTTARIAMKSSATGDNRVVVWASTASIMSGINSPTCKVFKARLSGSNANFDSWGNFASWGEGAHPVYISSTDRYYMVCVKIGAYSTDGSTITTNKLGDHVLTDITNNVGYSVTEFNSGNPTVVRPAFRPVYILDGFVGRSTVDDSTTGAVTGSSSTDPGLIQKQQVVSGTDLFISTETQASASSRAYIGTELRTFQPTDTTMIGDIISGGIVNYYDNLSAQEVDHIDYPSVYLKDKGSGSGPGAGTYNYIVIYEWIDKRGQRHLSRCSNASSITMGNSHAISIQVTLPAITNRYYFNNDVVTGLNIVAKVYRTTNGGTVYYLTGTVTSATTSPYVFYTTFDDVTSDANLITGSQLHRQPGTTNTALDRFPPPCTTCICRHKDRIFVARDNVAYYSSFFVDGEAPWFNPQFSFPVYGGSGPITAMSSIDGQLVIFKRDAIFVVDGDGPPENGGSGTEFSPPRRIATEYGCLEPRSLVTIPLGLIYRSNRGIELLTRASQVIWVGQEIKDTVNAYPIVSGAAYDRTRGRVYLILASAVTTDGRNDTYGTGVVAVFDTTVGQTGVWYVFKHTTSTGFGNPLQDVCFSRVFTSTSNEDDERVCWSDSSFLYSDSTSNLDVTAYVPFKIETAWISMTGPSGRIRVDDLIFLAKNLANHNITISVAYDYSSTYSDSFTWGPDITGSISLEQLQKNVENPNLIAVRFKIEDSVPADTAVFPVTTGAGCDILDLSVHIGPQGGQTLLPEAQRG